MGLNFEFSTSTRIIFGSGSFEKIPGLVLDFGDKVLIVTGRNHANAEKLSAKLLNKNITSEIISILSEPSIADVEKGVEVARAMGCKVIIGLGGGSVIDAAKAIAAMVPEKGKLIDYLEIIGNGEKLTRNPLPFIAIPTTAGTGAEVTKNAVIKSEDQKVKVSLRSDLMFPRIAVIDPLLTLSMTPEITAATGMDALTHLMESFVSCQSNPYVDTLCREGMKLIAESLSEVYIHGQNVPAREKMAMASMLGGMALANAKLGAVHGFAGPLGGMFAVPHGAVCASLLPAVMEVNIGAMKEQDYSLEKYDEVARILTRKTNADAVDGVEWVKNLVMQLQIPALSGLGISEQCFPELVEKAANSSSMKGNPVVLSPDNLFEILQKSF